MVDELGDKSERAWTDGSSDNLDVVFVDNLDNPEVVFSADEYFDQWMKKRDGYTVIVPEEKSVSSFETPFQSQIDEFEQKLELFPRSQSRRNPYIVSSKEDLGDMQVYDLNLEDSRAAHQEARSNFYGRQSSTVSFRRSDVRPEFLSPTIVNGIKYLQLIEGKQNIHDFGGENTFIDVTKPGNNERTYKQNNYDPRRVIPAKKEERPKGVTFFKDDFFKNLERDWRQGQRWQPDLKSERQKPRRKEKDRNWQDLLFLSEPKTSSGQKNSGHKKDLFGEKLNLYNQYTTPRQSITPKETSMLENTRIRQNTAKPKINAVSPESPSSRPSTPLPFLSGSQAATEDEVEHFPPEATRRQDDGTDWVPLINSGTSWDPVPLATVPPSLDSPFQMVVQYPRDAPTRPSFRKVPPHQRQEGSGRFIQVSWCLPLDL